MPYVPRQKYEPKPFIQVYTQPQPSQLIKIEPQPILEELPIEPLPESEVEVVSAVESEPEPLLEEIPTPEPEPESTEEI